MIKIKNTQSNLTKSKEDKNPTEFEIIFSIGFISVLVVSILKAITNFMYNSLFKEFAMFFVNDDFFATQCAIAGIFFNLITRFFMGKLYEQLGIKWVYFVNMVLELLHLNTILFFGKNKFGFFIFYTFNRISSGILLIL